MKVNVGSKMIFTTPNYGSEARYEWEGRKWLYGIYVRRKVDYFKSKIERYLYGFGD